MNQFKSKYIAFSAPSGAGKSTIVNKLLKKYQNLALSVSATTRNKRNNEVPGIHYFFLNHNDFQNALMEKRFIEYEEVHGNCYGTLRENVDKLTKNNKTVLFDIDVKGALSIKKEFNSAILIFIMPPDQETLKQRLINRKSDDDETIRRRLQRMDFEYEQSKLFDFRVINDRLEQAVQEVEKIILNEK